MYGYAASSATASQLAPFTAPQQTANPSGLAGQAAAVTQAAGTSAGTQHAMLSQLTSAVPATLQGLATPTAATSTSSSSSGLSGILRLLTGGSSGNAPLDNIWNQWGPNADVWNTIFSSGFYMPSNTMGAFMGLLGANAAGHAAGNAMSEAATGALGSSTLAGPLGHLGSLGNLGGSVSAGLGRATTLGPLSVPPSWTAAAPPITPLPSTLGATPLRPPAEAIPGMPGMPLTGMGANGGARPVPEYGFRPTVVARPPAAG